MLQRTPVSLTALALAALGIVALPAAGAPSAQQRAGFQIRAKTILLDDGTRISDGVLLIEEGKIRKVGRGVEVDPALPLVDHDGVLTAGMVVCQSESGTRGGASDPTRSVMPAARVADALDPTHPDLEQALAAGITTMVLSPGRGNVVGGRTAVVKTTGLVVEPQAHLALSFSRDALDGQRRGPEVLETVSSGRPGDRDPTSYPGALAELERLFASKEGVFGAAASGEVPVLIEAWQRHEVVRAADFARRHGLHGALRGATLASDVVDTLRESGLGVVLGPYAPAESSRAVDAVRALAEAGVPIAFALDGPAHDPEAVRFSAAMAVADGADPVVVWRALTGDAARLAGAAGRLGLLERGRDADLVLWSGDPLNLTSTVRAVYVDGKLAHRGATR